MVASPNNDINVSFQTQSILFSSMDFIVCKTMQMCTKLICQGMKFLLNDNSLELVKKFRIVTYRCAKNVYKILPSLYEYGEEA